MDNYILKWQEFSIKIAKQANGSGLKVGAVLVSEQNKIICTSCSSSDNDMNWDSIIINTVKKLGVQHAGKLFVTINIIAKNKTFSINNITEYISIDEIFFGLPDPMLQEYCTQDPYIEHNFVKRYEEKYQIDILEQNAQIYKNSPQNISNSPFYAGFRISHLLQEGLNKKGYSLMFDTIKEFKNTESLATALASYYHKDYTEMYEVVQDVLSSAFNTKYGAYSYENDTRSVDNSWLERFKNILDSSIDTSIHRIEIIDVGVGSGHEAVKLFNGYDDVTFVDIARDGLWLIKEHLPNSKTYMLNAEHLNGISNGRYDLYISLRTYNSSFFDIEKALKEAYRVLKHNGSIIISIANGFLRIDNKTIIPGLIIPRTDFVDIYRGVNIAKNIMYIMKQIGFSNVHVVPSAAEIYITAKKSKID